EPAEELGELPQVPLPLLSSSAAERERPPDALLAPLQLRASDVGKPTYSGGGPSQEAEVEPNSPGPGSRASGGIEPQPASLPQITQGGPVTEQKPASAPAEESIVQPCADPVEEKPAQSPQGDLLHGNPDNLPTHLEGPAEVAA
ncbi:unnamed protein product, partial [Symbiodinium pilosum]